MARHSASGRGGGNGVHLTDPEHVELRGLVFTGQTGNGLNVDDGGTPDVVEDDEPARLAEASARLGLKHVVITSVTRDDLPDGGAAHFAAAVAPIESITAANRPSLPRRSLKST